MRFTRLFAASVGPLLTFVGVPGEELVPPTTQRPPECTNLDGHRVVDEISHQLVEEPLGGLGRLAVEAEDGLLRVPAHPHFATRVAGLEEPEQLGVAF